MVDERTLAVDLDDGQPLAIARLELGIAADVDLFELELELRSRRGDRRTRSLTEMAAVGVVENDARGYG